MLIQFPKPPAHDQLKHFKDDDPEVKLRALRWVQAPSICFAAVAALAFVVILVLRFWH
jgi:hypothetical protein